MLNRLSQPNLLLPASSLYSFENNFLNKILYDLQKKKILHSYAHFCLIKSRAPSGIRLFSVYTYVPSILIIHSYVCSFF